MIDRHRALILPLAALWAAPLIAAAPEPAGRAEVDARSHRVRVEFYSDDVVRVLKWPAGGSPEKKSLVVRQSPSAQLAVPGPRRPRRWS